MNGSQQIRIFSVDDHPLLHEGLATVIRHQADMLMVAEAANGREAIQRFREHVPDVTLMDLRLPDMSGIDAMIAIRSEFPEARIIILTTFAGESEIRRALDAGARAYLLKSMPPKELMEVIRQVHAGKVRIPQEVAARVSAHQTGEPFTEREIEKPFPTGQVTKVSEARSQSSQRAVQRWVSNLFRRD
jgi:DNA-binding NarL/FixJ family response regulator